jgi:ABC-2 type transport system ATP-binding protein
LSADQHLAIGAGLNRSWDAAAARERLAALRIPTDRPVSTLSGGQRAQVALGLALAKRPRVLLLDEPVAALDPLARREFLTSLAAAVAEGDLSVVLSSHLLHDLERVCDHLVLLAASRAQICDDIEHILTTSMVRTASRVRSFRPLGPTTCAPTLWSIRPSVGRAPSLGAAARTRPRHARSLRLGCPN